MALVLVVTLALAASGAAQSPPGATLTGTAGTLAPIWAKIGAFAPTQGNQVRILIDGQAAFLAIGQAIQRARKYLYVTFAYLDLGFVPMPETDPRTILELLRDRAQHGVDVKLVIWQPSVTTATTVPDPTTPIPGVDDGPGCVQARWDKAPDRGISPLIVHGCNHQKSFVCDTAEGPIAFVGGINSAQPYWDTPEHEPFDVRRAPPGTDPADTSRIPPPLHDLFSEIRGPAVRDVATNFIQRYNSASLPHRDATEDARLPQEIETIAPRPGGVPAQVVRTIARGAYRDVPGDHGVRDIYVAAIHAARRMIYFENQYFFDDAVIDALQAAARRGVKVIGLITSRPDEGSFSETLMEKHFARQCARLPNIVLCTPGIAWPDPDRPESFRYREIYVHAKTLIVDGSFVTVGSANISFTSMGFHSELNIALNEPQLARDLQLCLWREHLQLDSLDASILDDPAAAQALWMKHSSANLQAFHAAGKPLSRVFPFGTTFP